MNTNKKLIVLSSPSGGGKTTVANFILVHYPKSRFSISATTRSKRDGEIDNQHYYFLSKEDFEKKIQLNDFVEYEKIFDNYYGTLKSEINNAIGNGEILIFDVDVKGALSLKKAFPDEALLIFLAPPSREVLESRLRNRNTETEEQIQKRLARADMEMATQNQFDYLIINNHLNETLEKVRKVLDDNL
jgi:guanylate kinase